MPSRQEYQSLRRCIRRQVFICLTLGISFQAVSSANEPAGEDVRLCGTSSGIGSPPTLDGRMYTRRT